MVAAVTGDDVLAAAELCERALEPALGADWKVPVPGLEFTVAGVVADAAEVPLWYSVDMWSGRENAAFEMKVLVDASNSSLLTSLLAASRLGSPLASTPPRPRRGVSIPSARRTPRGSRPWRATSCSCTVTMRPGGSGFPSRTMPGLAGAVLARLFPWHTVGRDDDPWRLLLWASGRIELAGRLRQSVWRWHCAPLSEWDGTGP